MELLTVVAMLGVLSALTVSGLQPLVTRFRQREAEEATAQFLVRARQRAVETGRCHRVDVLEADVPVAVGTEGGALWMRGHPTADCEAAPAPSTLRDVERLSLPESMRVRQDTPDELVYLPNGRLRGGASGVLWVGTAEPREVRALPHGPVCVMGPGEDCP